MKSIRMEIISIQNIQMKSIRTKNIPMDEKIIQMKSIQTKNIPVKVYK